MPDSCLVCKRLASKELNVTLHRFPPKSQIEKRKKWLKALNLTEDDIAPHHKVCTRHFQNGDTNQVPTLHLGRKFVSPKKRGSTRSERISKRNVKAQAESSRTSTVSPRTTPMATDSECASDSSVNVPMCSTPIGETLMSTSDYSVYELPEIDSSESSRNVSALVQDAILPRLQALEKEKEKLVEQFQNEKHFFGIESISHNDSLIQLYTGFKSYEHLMLFYELLGPSVHHLNYWGKRKTTTFRLRKLKLSPLNQLFLTLIKLKLNLPERDIAYRFGIATSTVSKYFTTWVCFLYYQLSEIDWRPSPEQVRRTLPQSFREKYSDTYIILDATEIFIQTPCDLHNQSSTWSSYKHHNTGKLLVGCSPNGAIFFISPLYAGSVSDVELTRVSGFPEFLQGKQGICVMADRGFNIKDQLSKYGVSLNIPPFMEGRSQLSLNDIKRGRKISSLRIHVERAIGRIKNFSILQGTMPLTMSRIADKIVTVCALLTNFQPVLIPPINVDDISDVEDYFTHLSDTDYEADTELSDID